MCKQYFFLLFVFFVGNLAQLNAQSVFHVAFNSEQNLYRTDLFNFDKKVQEISSSSPISFSLALERALTKKSSIKLGITAFSFTNTIIERRNDPNWDRLDMRVTLGFQFDWGHRFYFNDPQYLGEGMYGPYLGTNLSLLNLSLSPFNSRGSFISSYDDIEHLILRPGIRVGYQIPTFFELDLFAQINYGLSLNNVTLTAFPDNKPPIEEKFNIINPISFTIGVAIISGY